ncbi:Protein of unknown function [Gryllus bimaculatus]|nr:Protein of unknown function [Gryllus bimaculatus]
MAPARWSEGPNGAYTSQNGAGVVVPRKVKRLSLEEWRQRGGVKGRTTPTPRRMARAWWSQGTSSAYPLKNGASEVVPRNVKRLSPQPWRQRGCPKERQAHIP